ncbi:hypothetical protein KIW84_050231 [Lathyrus oleraceus]|uniref:PRONE domain-containing protein n=1 Tax=Pisum sativum TaxID=3888 RepID=A0A9D4WIU2_PEA|nr:hypothetical protein KIW84_050231 [Pisum sativum]
MRTTYELLPESGKVVTLDVDLPVKQAFRILHEQGVPMAPLWDFCKRQFVGVLTWKEGKGIVLSRRFIHAGPYDNLKDVALRILQNGISIVPVIGSPSEDGSFPQLRHLASHLGILRCILQVSGDLLSLKLGASLVLQRSQSSANFIYRYITSYQFSSECLLDRLDISSEHIALKIANRVEAALYKSDESQLENVESDESKPSHAQVTEEHTESQPTNSPVLEEPAETQHKRAPKITSRGSSLLQNRSRKNKSC